MKVYIVPETSGKRKAFISIGGNSSYLLCIGTEEEVDKATPDELSMMVQMALATAVYNSLEAHKAIQH